MIAGTSPAHQLQRAKVGGYKAHPGDPRGHLPSRHEELFAGFGGAPHIEADKEHHGEINGDDRHIHGRQMDELLSAGNSRHQKHAFRVPSHLMDAEEEYLRSGLIERCFDLRPANAVLCNRDAVAGPMLARYFMARDVLVGAACGGEYHNRAAARRGRDLFVDLGAGRDNTRNHGIAFCNIITNLFDTWRACCR